MLYHRFRQLPSSQRRRDRHRTAPTEDHAALADAILKLYHTPAAQRQQMGSNGRAAVLAQYEYGALAGKLADVLFHDASPS